MAKHLPSSTLETKLYLAAFLSTIAVSIIMICFVEGRVDEALRRYHEIDDQIDQEQMKAEYWETKYLSLSHEAGYVAVLEAEAKYQEQTDGR